MLIDPSYFKGGKVYIPNVTSNPSITGNAATSAVEIESYIAKFEEDLLANAIGYENYKALELAITQDPTLTDPVNLKWKELVHGKAYSFEGKGVEWKGLTHNVGTLKSSLIADYVFCHYLTDNFQHFTTTGMQKEKAKNAEEQSPNLKLTQVWREFIQKYQFGVVTHPVNVFAFRGPYTDYYSANFNYSRSLYQFLLDNDVYGDYNFKTYENRNRFGL